MAEIVKNILLKMWQVLVHINCVLWGVLNFIKFDLWFHHVQLLYILYEAVPVRGYLCVSVNFACGYLGYPVCILALIELIFISIRMCVWRMFTMYRPMEYSSGLYIMLRLKHVVQTIKIWVVKDVLCIILLHCTNSMYKLKFVDKP